MFAIRNKRSLCGLRSQYETEIRNAARQEERARLARDLHDAVKQQLFVIQTARRDGAGALRHRRAGARAAVEQVRTAAREAMTEMEAMLDQLQSAPISNAGLVAFLRKQCEAIGFRTGAAVRFEPGALPDDRMLDPGVRQAIARVAQEALSNVARHARARNVEVSLGLVEGSLVLTVRDDGGGFAPGDQPPGHGHGESRGACRGSRRLAAMSRASRETGRPCVSASRAAGRRRRACTSIRAAVWIGVLPPRES